MRRRCVSMFLSYVVLGVIAGCGKGPSNQAPPVHGTALAVPVEKLAIAAGIQFQNLTIFPVVSNVPRDDDRFITLDEGIRAQTVQVVEVGGIAGAGQFTASNADPFGEPLPADDELPAAIADDPFGDQPGRVSGCPTVNRVLVVNRSEKPLYLMPGETIVGGQQDRTLAEEMLIPPGGKPVEVPVFCVEHGRWANRSAGQTAMLADRLEFSNNAALVVESFAPLAEDVGASGFLPGAGSLNKQSRLAVQQSKDQGAVWDNVAQVNAKTSVDAPTGGFTRNFADSSLQGDLRPYLAHFEQTIANRQRIVGVIVAINGSVESVDVFESTPLFCKLWPKLLHGYALDASMRADEDNAAQSIALVDAQRFYDELVNADIKAEDVSQELTLASHESSSTVGFSLHEHAAGTASDGGGMEGAMGGGMMGGMGGGMGGGFGGSVHSAGYSK